MGDSPSKWSTSVLQAGGEREEGGEEGGEGEGEGEGEEGKEYVLHQLSTWSLHNIWKVSNEEGRIDLPSSIDIQPMVERGKNAYARMDAARAVKAIATVLQMIPKY